MKCYLFVVIAITVLVGLLAVLGICGDVFLVQDFRGIGEETRYCMGFTHPNTYHIVLVQLLLAFIWINWKRIRWYYFAVFFMVNLGITYFTDSRTSFIVGSCVCVAYLLIKIVPFLQRWIGTYLIGFGVLVACVALSVYVAMFGHMRPFTSALNKLWTNRVYWAYTARLESQLTLFSGTEYQISCDMGFIKICYCYGIIIILLVLGLMVWRFAKAAYHKEVVVLIGLVACLVFFLGETFASGEFVTRNLLFIYMLGWGKDSIYVSEEESDTRTISMYY